MVKRLAIAVAAGALLSGCAAMPWNWTGCGDPWDYTAVSKMDCSGSPFDCHLRDFYVDLADYEYGGRYSGGDWDSVLYYTGKARMAAEGRTPAPTDLSTVDTGAYTPELTAARAELVGVLSSGATTANPLVAAKAQASFDCWVEEAEEDMQPIRIQECRTEFEEAMRILRGSPSGIHFATGSAALDREGVRTVEGAVAMYRLAEQSGTSARLIVTGYTDTVGNARTNLALSQRRAEAVANALISRGVPASAIVIHAQGEHNLAIPTADQTANRSNRRVEITLER